MSYEEEQEIITKIKSGEFEEVSYPHGTVAFYDSENDIYYNRSAQRLRNPSEYNKHSEGYTPFGDEGDDYTDDGL